MYICPFDKKDREARCDLTLGMDFEVVNGVEAGLTLIVYGFVLSSIRDMNICF